jgi:RNA polymerase sigma-70 factor, ECF subfamily
MSAAPTAREVIAQVWRQEAAVVTAALTRIVRDLGLAEELAQDALVAALEQWPTTGVPARPGAWLMTTARNRALNRLRRARMMERKHEQLGHELAAGGALDRAPDDGPGDGTGDSHARFSGETLAQLRAFETSMDPPLDDEVLRLVFTACHPVLSREARVALTLRVIGGLSTSEIARAFLASEPAIGQRVVRAKRALAEDKVPLEVPRPEELSGRLASVLEVVYLIFNEGYAATAGDDLMRPALCDEAMRLGSLLAQLAPAEAEAHGLLALMRLTASRAPARVDAAGEPVLLLEQARARWDAELIAAGLADLERAEALGPPRRGYRLQAAIAACHARARHPEHTDWARIAALYGELGELSPSPIIELNRAVAISRAEGPAAGLVLLDALASAPALAGYHLLPSARADLLERLGRHAEAGAEFERAAAMAENGRQRERLKARAAACGAMSETQRGSH